MTIRFTCGCGQQMAVADEHAGKRVKCRGCGGLRTVPAAVRPAVAPAPALPAARQPRTAPPPLPTTVATRPLAPPRIECACGQTYQARPEYAGKKIRCPKCSKTLTVPSSSPETSARRASSLDDDEEERPR